MDILSKDKEEVTNYLYDRQNVILETDANNKVKTRYVKGINIWGIPTLAVELVECA